MADDTSRKLIHALNPCDYDRYRGLNAVGDSVAWLWNKFTAGTDCPCCLGFRMLGAIGAAFALGALIF